MAANFNFTYSDDIDGSGAHGLKYADSNGNEIELIDRNILTRYTEIGNLFNLAPEYSKQVYPANSLVMHYNFYLGMYQFYYNPNAISTPESWNANHWTATTLAEYIKLMTTT